MTVVCRSAFFHLRNISRIRRYLTAESTEQVLHVFVTSRLDVGKTLLHRLNQIQRLQRVQYWAARLIDGATKLSHATPLLITLHWVPIAVRLEFKILLLVHRAPTGHAPEYNRHCVNRCQPVRSLRSRERNLLCVPRARCHWGDRSFDVAAPALWNLLPQHLTSTQMTDAVLYQGLRFTRFLEHFVRRHGQ